MRRVFPHPDSVVVPMFATLILYAMIPRHYGVATISRLLKYTYVYIYTYMHVYAVTYKYMYIYIHRCVHKSICVCVCVCESVFDGHQSSAYET